jgi:hypothetical protein
VARGGEARGGGGGAAVGHLGLEGQERQRLSEINKKEC